MTTIFTSPRAKRTANILGLVLLIALVAPFVVYAVPEVVSADQSFVVLTPSMTPAIAPGDVVVVAERDPATIVEGDVITFSRGTSAVPVTHRVIDVVETANGLAFETMGDANEGPDPGLVPAANLVGVVALTIPYIGFVVQFAGTPAGFVALVLLPFGLLAATEVWSLVRDRTRDESAPAVAATTGDDADVSDADVSDADDSATGPATTVEPAATGGISVDTVGGATAVLALFAPYAIYIAFQLRTAAPIAVAIGSSTLLLGALAMWVPASGVLTRSGATDASDSDDSDLAETIGATDGGNAEAPAAADEAEGADGDADPFTSPDSLDDADAAAGPSVTPPHPAERTGEGD